MLLDDSIELEYNDYSANAEALPLNWDIGPSQIWIPSSLLPNRKKSINLDENKPFIFHTLVKPDESKSFSVYSDEYSKHLEPQAATALAPQKLINYNFKKLQQGLPTFEIAVESATKLGIFNNDGTALLHPVNSNTLNDSLTDVQAIQNSAAENTIIWKEKTYDCSKQNIHSKASVEDLARRMDQILSEHEPLETDWFHRDIIETNPLTTLSTFDSMPPSTKDSLEDVYYSDDDDHHFDVEEYELANRESESPKKFINSIYTDNSYAHEQSSESFTNNLSELEQAENNIIKTVCQSFKETTKIPFVTQNVAVDNALNQTEHNELYKLEKAVHSKDSLQELLSCEEESKDPTEKVVEFPIAYIRPPLQENTIKTKPKKEKKKVKKCKINMPLEDLFQKEEVDRFKVPEVDEFYENLVRQGKCQPYDHGSDFDKFPSVNFSEKLQSNVHLIPSINFPEMPQILFKQSTDSEMHSSSPQEVIQNEEKIEPELESNISLDTIVIDNIHLNVTKESIENFISEYGELKKLVIEQRGKFQRAILQMNFNCDIDWIIDCLNGSQPFECVDKEVVKCYRLS